MGGKWKQYKLREINCLTWSEWCQWRCMSQSQCQGRLSTPALVLLLTHSLWFGWAVQGSVKSTVIGVWKSHGPVSTSSFVLSADFTGMLTIFIHVTNNTEKSCFEGNHWWSEGSVLGPFHPRTARGRRVRHGSHDSLWPSKENTGRYWGG